MIWWKEFKFEAGLDMFANISWEYYCRNDLKNLNCIYKIIFKLNTKNINFDQFSCNDAENN